MRLPRGPDELGLTVHDRRRLARALRRTRDARQFRRLLAVRLVAEGRSVSEASHVSCLSRPAVYRWLTRYLAHHSVEALADEPRNGRPPAAPSLTAEVLLEALCKAPYEEGYATHGWTVALLATHLYRTFGIKVSQRTLRRRMHALRLRWKRPRYEFATRALHVPQKKGALFAV